MITASLVEASTINFSTTYTTVSRTYASGSTYMIDIMTGGVTIVSVTTTSGIAVATTGSYNTGSNFRLYRYNMIGNGSNGTITITLSGATGVTGFVISQYTNTAGTFFGTVSGNPNAAVLSANSFYNDISSIAYCYTSGSTVPTAAGFKGLASVPATSGATNVEMVVGTISPRVRSYRMGSISPPPAGTRIAFLTQITSSTGYTASNTTQKTLMTTGIGK